MGKFYLDHKVGGGARIKGGDLSLDITITKITYDNGELGADLAIEGLAELRRLHLEDNGIYARITEDILLKASKKRMGGHDGYKKNVVKICYSTPPGYNIERKSASPKGVYKV